MRKMPYMMNEIEAKLTINVPPNAGLIMNIMENMTPSIDAINSQPQPFIPDFCTSIEDPIDHIERNMIQNPTK